MRIVQIAPFEERVPPLKYGGIELVVYNLTEELVKRDHKVYLISSGDSKSSAEILPVFPKSIRKLPQAQDMKMRDALKFIGVGRVVELLKKINVDIIHNHLGWRLLPFSHLFKAPIITTLHGPLNIKYQKAVYGNFKKYFYVSISNNQRRPLPSLNYVKTIYNGIDIKEFQFNDKPKNYFAFLGRMSPEKGAKEAIKVAKRAGVKLKMAAKIDVVDKDYFKKEIKPVIDGKQIRFIGEIGTKEKSNFLRNAIALLSPIQWEEPFGLYFIESMTCGTPVIAFKRGSVPEIIKDGATGFIYKANDINSMIKTVKKISQMPGKEYLEMRYNCREHVEKNFTAEIMANEYEALYYKILKNEKKT